MSKNKSVHYFSRTQTVHIFGLASISRFHQKFFCFLFSTQLWYFSYIGAQLTQTHTQYTHTPMHTMTMAYAMTLCQLLWCQYWNVCLYALTTYSGIVSLWQLLFAALTNSLNPKHTTHIGISVYYACVCVQWHRTFSGIFDANFAWLPMRTAFFGCLSAFCHIHICFYHFGNCGTINVSLHLKSSIF